MLNRILGDVGGIEIVTIQCHTGCHSIRRDTIVLQHAFHLDKLRIDALRGNIFYLCCRQRHAILFFAKPRNQVIPKKKTPTRCTFSIFGVVSPINITIPHQGYSGVMREYHIPNLVVTLTYLIIFLTIIR